jgi:hypothetical protein
MSTWVTSVGARETKKDRVVVKHTDLILEGKEKEES